MILTSWATGYNANATEMQSTSYTSILPGVLGPNIIINSSVWHPRASPRISVTSIRDNPGTVPSVVIFAMTPWRYVEQIAETNWILDDKHESYSSFYFQFLKKHRSPAVSDQRNPMQHHRHVPTFGKNVGFTRWNSVSHLDDLLCCTSKWFDNRWGNFFSQATFYHCSATSTTHASVEWNVRRNLSVKLDVRRRRGTRNRDSTLIVDFMVSCGVMVAQSSTSLRFLRCFGSLALLGFIHISPYPP